MLPFNFSSSAMMFFETSTAFVPDFLANESVTEGYARGASSI